MIPFLFAAAAAAAAEPDPGAQWQKQLFVAPSGEPFRAAQGAPYPVADWFARADADHDGKLTEAEFVADFQRFAASLDANHDGVIDGQELTAYETDILPEVHAEDYAPPREGGEDDSRSGVPEPARAMGAGRFGLLNIPEPLAAMDTDINGRITRTEVADAASYRFGLLDVKQQGFLTLADLPQPPVRSPSHGYRRHKGR
jgi:hypothetical protein